MNDKRLLIYLNDHSAVMLGEADLARRCLSSNEESPLGEFLQKLSVEIENQRAMVTEMIERMGGAQNVVKQGAAWFAEKLGRLKLNDSLLAYSDLSRLVELEALSVAAQGRITMWDTLQMVGADDQRFSGITFSYFREQSEQQLVELSSRRRYAAAEAFQ